MAESLFEKRLTGLHAEIDLGVNMRWFSNKYGTPEYWKTYERELNSAAKDFEEFVRDHRSRDEYGITIVREYQNVCKFCGYAYPEGFNGIADCCDEMMDAQNVKIESIR